MNITILYFSTSGNTKKVAELIQSGLKRLGECNLIDLSQIDASEEDIQLIFTESDLLIVGSPVFHLSYLAPLRDLLVQLPAVSVDKKLAACFVTYGHVSSGKSLQLMSQTLQEKGYTILAAMKTPAPHFFETELKFPLPEDIEIINVFCNALITRFQNPIPWKTLVKSLQFQKKRVGILFPLVQRYSPHRVPPIHFNPEICEECYMCEEVCPIHIIDISNLVRKMDSCLHCYQCVSICPTGAMSSDIDRIRHIVNFNKHILSEDVPRAVY